MSEDTIPLHYTVGVIEFASVDPDESGIGGFEWRSTPEDLEKALRRLIRGGAGVDTEYIIGLVDVPADMVPGGDFADLRPSERHAITEHVEVEVHFGRVRNRQRLVVLANPSWPGAEMRRVLHLAHNGDQDGLCPRHGGEWGDDVTCPKCTDQDGNPRPRQGGAS